MAKYRKLIVALIGAALVAINTFFGVELAIGAEGVLNVLIPVLTAFGVWAAPNSNA